MRCSHTPHCWPVAGATQHCALGRTNNLPRSILSQTSPPKSSARDSEIMCRTQSYEASSRGSAEDWSSNCPARYGLKEPRSVAHQMRVSTLHSDDFLRRLSSEDRFAAYAADVTHPSSGP